MNFRRTIPVLTFFAILAVTATVMTPWESVSSATVDDQHLSGAWVVEVTPTGASAPPPFTNLGSFTKDGGVVNVDHFGFASVREWVRTGNSEFAVTFRGLFVDSGQNMSFKVRSTVILDTIKEKFNGPFKTDVFDSTGTLVFSFSGTVAASRIGVEPL